MPLKTCHQKSKKAKNACTSKNIREMRKAGHPHKQAVDIALAKAGKAKKRKAMHDKKHGMMSLAAMEHE